VWEGARYIDWNEMIRPGKYIIIPGLLPGASLVVVDVTRESMKIHSASGHRPQINRNKRHMTKAEAVGRGSEAAARKRMR